MNSRTDRAVRPRLSLVVPVYNSEAIFPELYKRSVAALEPVVESFEFIAVLDGCRDRSWEVVSQIATKDSRLKAIEFSRNFGHQAAITAGLRFAAGEMVAVMDDDLEDPPELLADFVAKSKEGFDVVYGIRRKRERSGVHRLLYKGFYRILGGLADIEIPHDAGDFCLMTRRVVDVMNAMPETNRYLRGMRAWCGFAQTGIEYDREQRFASAPGYTIRKYVALALDAIFSFSYRPLRFVSMAGLAIATLSFLYGATMIVAKLMGRIHDVPGWATLVVSILFLSGIQLISVGIIGEYISRIYDEVKQRPKFVIRNSLGLERKEGDGRPAD